MSSPAPTTAVHKHYGYTEVKTQHLTYEWTIKNFSLLSEKNGDYISSSPFRAKEDDDLEWVLQLYPRGEEEEDSDYVSLFLCLDTQCAEERPIQVHCEVTISNSQGIKDKGSFVYEYEESCAFGFRRMSQRCELLDWCGSDDLIIIGCAIDVAQRTMTNPVYPVSFDLQEGKLSEHFSYLFQDPRFSDVTIIVGGEKYPAHKVVLAARSPVFAAMFEHAEMQENRKNEVKIEDMEPVTVKGMLEFIYTDKVTDLEISSRDLLRASDKYDLLRLRRMCEEVLYKNLTTDNAVESLMLSDLYHSIKLKECVMAFIDGHLPSVVQSESYKGMVKTHSALLDELMCFIAARR